MRLVFRKYPLTLWIAGFVVMMCSAYLVYHLSFRTWGTLFKGYEEGHWWQYIVAAFIFILGVVFCYGGKVESVTIDKRENLLILKSTNIFCRSKSTPHSLKDVTNVRAVKKGHDGVNFYTLHYTI